MTSLGKGSATRWLALVALVGCVGEIDGEDRLGTRTDAVTRPPATASPAAKTAETERAPAPPPAVAPTSVSPGPAATAANPTRGAEPNMAPASAGLFDCPTVAPPAYETADAPPSPEVTPVLLSPQYRSVCAPCHGAAGQGQPPYPALPGGLDGAAFVRAVRSGRDAMPAFGSAYISDGDLLQDFATLRSMAGKPAGGASPTAVELQWSAARVQQAYAQGLAVWRKPDPEGAACAHCHSPDGIELAVIGYSDATVLRRALRHLQPTDALVLRDFVHAQRRRHNIARPCSPDWRVFQPGGQVLPGVSVAAQDLAFGDQLQANKLLLATGRVDSLSAAQRAFDELAAVDLRRLRIGIPLPRWSSDRFNGSEHASFDDWMTPVANVPADPVKWLSLSDRYLQDPTMANLRALDDLSRTGSILKAPPIESAVYQNDANWARDASYLKYRAVLLGAHYLRRAALAQDGWFEKPRSLDLGSAYNPFSAQGSLAQEQFCALGAEKTCPRFLDSLKPDTRAEFPPAGQWRAIDDVFRNFSHHWWTLGQVFDQSLLHSENGRGPESNAFYWNVFNFPHAAIHQPFLNAHRFVQQIVALRGRPLTANVDPVLHGEWLDVPGLVAQQGEPQDRRAAISARLRANLIRMFLYLQRDLLAKGAGIYMRDATYSTRMNTKVGVLQTLEKWRGVAREIGKRMTEPGGAALYLDVAREPAFATTEVEALIDEVMALAKRAPEGYSGK